MKFEILTQTLTDGSTVYYIRFFLDNPTRYVDLHCIDKDRAESLLDELRNCVSYVEVG